MEQQSENGNEEQAGKRKRARRRRKWSPTPTRRSNRAPVKRVKDLPQNPATRMFDGRKFRWPTQEKQLLLRALRESKAHGQFEYHKLRRTVPKRTKGDVEQFVTNLRHKAIKKSTTVMKKKSPIEIWNELMSKFGDTTKECCTVMSKVMAMASMEKETSPETLALPDFKPVRVYQYLGALLKDKAPPSLSPLESQVILDCFQDMLGVLQRGDIRDQGAFLRSQYYSLYERAYCGGWDFQPEDSLDLCIGDLNPPPRANGHLDPSHPGTSASESGEGAALGGCGSGSDSGSGGKKAVWRSLMGKSMETRILNPLAIPVELLLLKPKRKPDEGTEPPSQNEQEEEEEDEFTSSSEDSDSEDDDDEDDDDEGGPKPAGENGQTEDGHDGEEEGSPDQDDGQNDDEGMADGDDDHNDVGMVNGDGNHCDRGHDDTEMVDEEGCSSTPYNHNDDNVNAWHSARENDHTVDSDKNEEGGRRSDNDAGHDDDTSIASEDRGQSDDDHYHVWTGRHNEDGVHCYNGHDVQMTNGDGAQDKNDSGQDEGTGMSDESGSHNHMGIINGDSLHSNKDNDLDTGVYNEDHAPIDNDGMCLGAEDISAASVRNPPVDHAVNSAVGCDMTTLLPQQKKEHSTYVTQSKDGVYSLTTDAGTCRKGDMANGSLDTTAFAGDALKEEASGVSCDYVEANDRAYASGTHMFQRDLKATSFHSHNLDLTLEGQKLNETLPQWVKSRSDCGDELLTIDVSHLGPDSNIVIPASILPGGLLTIRSPHIPKAAAKRDAQSVDTTRTQVARSVNDSSDGPCGSEHPVSFVGTESESYQVRATDLSDVVSQTDLGSTVSKHTADGTKTLQDPPKTLQVQVTTDSRSIKEIIVSPLESDSEVSVAGDLSDTPIQEYNPPRYDQGLDNSRYGIQDRSSDTDETRQTVPPCPNDQANTYKDLPGQSSNLVTEGKEKQERPPKDPSSNISQVPLSCPGPAQKTTPPDNSEVRRPLEQLSERDALLESCRAFATVPWSEARQRRNMARREMEEERAHATNSWLKTSRENLVNGQGDAGIVNKSHSPESAGLVSPHHTAKKSVVLLTLAKSPHRSKRKTSYMDAIRHSEEDSEEELPPPVIQSLMPINGHGHEQVTGTVSDVPGPQMNEDVLQKGSALQLEQTNRSDLLEQSSHVVLKEKRKRGRPLKSNMLDMPSIQQVENSEKDLPDELPISQGGDAIEKKEQGHSCSSIVATKRKRGRPKKVEDSEQSDVEQREECPTSSQEVEDFDGGVVAAKRKRGRPRKFVDSEQSDVEQREECPSSSQEVEDAGGDVVAAKRKRGRPRKVVDSKQSEVEQREECPTSSQEVEDFDGGVVVAKRKRGRPRKVVEPEHCDEEQKEECPTSSQEVEDAGGDVVAAKRKRGRPRKVVDSEQSDVEQREECPTSSQEVEDFDEGVVVAKRKRGRPKKVVEPMQCDEEQKEECSTSSQELEYFDGGVVVAKRKRGRPNKFLEKEQCDEEQGEECPMSPQEFTQVKAFDGGVVAAKRKRGRPRKFVDSEQRDEEQWVECPTSSPRVEDSSGGVEAATQQRGRPNTVVDSEQSDKEQRKECLTSLLDVDDFGEGGVAAKRKRGRPKKVVEPEQGDEEQDKECPMSPQEFTQVKAFDGGVEAAKRKRGRRKKVLEPEQGDEEQWVECPTSSPRVEDSSRGIEAATQKRGRPKKVVDSEQSDKEQREKCLTSLQDVDVAAKRKRGRPKKVVEPEQGDEEQGKECLRSSHNIDDAGGEISCTTPLEDSRTDQRESKKREGSFESAMSSDKQENRLSMKRKSSWHSASKILLMADGDAGIVRETRLHQSSKTQPAFHPAVRLDAGESYQDPSIISPTSGIKYLDYLDWLDLQRKKNNASEERRARKSLHVAVKSSQSQERQRRHRLRKVGSGTSLRRMLKDERNQRRKKNRGRPPKVKRLERSNESLQALLHTRSPQPPQDGPATGKLRIGRSSIEGRPEDSYKFLNIDSMSDSSNLLEQVVNLHKLPQGSSETPKQDTERPPKEQKALSFNEGLDVESENMLTAAEKELPFCEPVVDMNNPGKQKRGRPLKMKRPENCGESIDVDSITDAAGLSEEDASLYRPTGVISETHKRKRGGPVKLKRATDLLQTREETCRKVFSGTENDISPLDRNDPVTQKPKRGRGRPPKVTLAELVNKLQEVQSRKLSISQEEVSGRSPVTTVVNQSQRHKMAVNVQSIVRLKRVYPVTVYRKIAPKPPLPPTGVEASHHMTPEEVSGRSPVRRVIKRKQKEGSKKKQRPKMAVNVQSIVGLKQVPPLTALKKVPPKLPPLTAVQTSHHIKPALVSSKKRRPSPLSDRLKKKVTFPESLEESNSAEINDIVEGFSTVTAASRRMSQELGRGALNLDTDFPRVPKKSHILFGIKKVVH